jgi:polar amino acid transport system permease protein
MFEHLRMGAIFAPPFGHELLHGIANTLILTGASWSIAVVLGLFLAVVRSTDSRLAEALVAAFVSYHQNVPMLVQLLVWYFGVPTLLPDSMQSWINGHNGEMFFSTIAVGLCVSAYVSEDIRSGLRSIPWGQHEAARALGLDFYKAMRFVILPQAVRIATPPFVNHTVLLFKNTSLAMVVGAAELTYTVREIENQTFRTFETYAVATIFYLAISLVLMRFGDVLARQNRIPRR